MPGTQYAFQGWRGQRGTDDEDLFYMPTSLNLTLKAIKNHERFLDWEYDTTHSNITHTQTASTPDKISPYLHYILLPGKSSQGS